MITYRFFLLECLFAEWLRYTFAWDKSKCTDKYTLRWVFTLSLFEDFCLEWNTGQQISSVTEKVLRLWELDEKINV